VAGRSIDRADLEQVRRAAARYRGVTPEQQKDCP
jgi:hypothetical protein